MSEISTIIRQFLQEQKTDFLEKRIAQETRDKKTKYDKFLEKLKDTESDYEQLTQEKQKYDQSVAKARAKFQPEADEKYEVITWINNAFSKVKPNITTHPAKFTDPKIKGVTSFLFYGSKRNDGYVKTGNVCLDVKVDVSGNSATNTIIFELYSLLSKQLKNGHTLISLFEEDNHDLIGFINSININFTLMKDKCLEVFYGKDAEQFTHELIRQVYFTDGFGDYHLLSIVAPSILMFETKNRIDAFDRWVNGQHIRKLKKDNKFDSEGFDEIFNLTEIWFGYSDKKDPVRFTKMGNVSFLNVKNHFSYLLPSIPPTFNQRQIRLPTHDFFKNSLRPSQFKESFQTLHNLITTPVNNVHIRQGISNTLKYIIDQVLQRAFRIRTTGEGWSNTEHYQLLPLTQRIWLDDIHQQQRENEDDWVNDITRSFARWILQAYESSCKDTHIKLSDHDLREIHSVVDEAVSNDQEFFK